MKTGSDVDAVVHLAAVVGVPLPTGIGRTVEWARARDA